MAISKEGIFVSSRKYTHDLLTKTGMLGCRPADTPIEFNCKLGNFGDQVPTHKEQYQHLVGKLVYLSHTRPDISFDVSVVSQFIQVPYREDYGRFTLNIFPFLSHCIILFIPLTCTYCDYQKIIRTKILWFLSDTWVFHVSRCSVGLSLSIGSL